MKSSRLIPVLVLSLAVCIQVNAQQKKSITLAEAVQMGVQNSKLLKGSRARIDEATAALKEAVQKRLPDAGINGSYLRLSNANVDMASKSNNGGTAQPAESPAVSQALYGMANVSMPIYTGSRIRYGIESSRLLQEATLLDAEHDKEKVMENIIEAYINLYKAGAAVNLVHENLAQSQKRVLDLTNLEKNGLLARNDLLKAELQSSNTELALLDAENNRKLANVNMNLLLGLPTETELVTDAANILQPHTLKPLVEYLQAAASNRKDLAALDLRKQASATGEKIVKGEYLPSLQLTGGYVAAKIPGLITISNAVNIGVGVSYNIGSLWKTKARLQQAEARTKQLAASQAVMDDQVQLQVNQRYLNFLSSQKKIDVYAKAVEQAEENYKISKNKYDNSLLTTTELLDADVAQLQAKLNYTFAKADAVVAYQQLLLSAGLTENNLNQ